MAYLSLLARPNSKVPALAFIAFLSLAPGQLHARCELAVPPAIPEDPEMSVAEMAQVKEQVQTYMRKAKSYIGCVKRQRKREKTVTEMRLVAANYNVLIQFYREYAAEQKALRK